MLKQILDGLKTGDRDIASMWQKLDAQWAEWLARIDDQSVDDLAHELTFNQTIAERICDGSRSLGKGMYAWTAFAHLYTLQDGIGDNGRKAVKLADAFEKSMVSIEVKYAAKEAAKQYAVDDYRD